MIYLSAEIGALAGPATIAPAHWSISSRLGSLNKSSTQGVRTMNR
jgi:hypothetical protein